MLRITIATLIIILTMKAASAQPDLRDLQDIQAGQNSYRTQQEKKNDRDIDRTYQSSIKRLPDAEKKKSEPWADVRSAPPAAAKDKQRVLCARPQRTGASADVAQKIGLHRRKFHHTFLSIMQSCIAYEMQGIASR